MALTHLDLPALRRWLVTARADVAAYEHELNQLNVFPVADSDTGTNLLVTFDGALSRVTGQPDVDLAHAAERLAHAMLVAARGNSGLILSQLARGIYEVIGAEDFIGPAQVVDMMRRASDYARAGVSEPVEGTVLTVAAAAAAGGERALEAGADLAGVVDALVACGHDALLATTNQLEVLRDRGVVDAGGAGLLLVLEALQRVVAGRPGLARSRRHDPEWLPIPEQTAAAAPAQADPVGPAYEVMYLLGRSSDKQVAKLREALSRVGDSVVVAGGSKVWSVHVHTDDVAAALNLGVAAGRPRQFSVTRFADQAAGGCASRVALFATVDGAGMTSLAREAGVRPLPLRTDAGARRALVRAMRDCAAKEVLLLGAVPALRETVADIVTSLATDGIRVAAPVSPTSAHVLAALAVIDPEASLDDSLSVITSTLESVHAATVSFADEAAGQFGVDELIASTVDGHVLGQGADLTEVGLAAARALVAARDAEIVTLIRGAGVPAEEVDRLAHELRDLQVEQVDGGSADIALTIGVE